MKRYLFASFGAPTTTPVDAPLQHEVQRLVRSLQEALRGGLADDFADVFRALTEHGDELRSAAVIWIEAIQRLVQAAEQRYPSKHGALKKSVVKSAARYVIERDRFDVPGIPAYLEPFVIDVAVDWTIDVLVQVSKDHGLWDTGKNTGYHLWSPVTRTLPVLAAIGNRVWPVLLAVPLAVWRFLERNAYLTPELKAALDDVVKRRLLSRKMDLLGRAPDAIVWIGEHGEELKAVVQVAAEAVQLAEGFVDKSGPEKHDYARSLILAALQELGISFGDGLIGMLADAFIDTTIDSAVNLFNTFPQHRPAFEHRKRTAPASAPPARPVVPASPRQPAGFLNWKLQKLRR